MSWRPILLFAYVTARTMSWGQETAEPQLSEIPLEQWLVDKDTNRFHMAMRVTDPQLTYHQRLLVRVEIQVDGSALAPRKGQGLTFLLEVKDSEGHPYRTRHDLEPADAARVSSRQNLVFSQNLFIVPGDYRVATGVYDPMTGEHSAQQRMLHVGPLKNDPLPASWEGLPTVEFMQEAGPLDAAFLPYLKGRVRLSFTSEKPIGLNVIVNTSPGPTRHSLRYGESHFVGSEPLLAAMKILARAEVASGELNLALADVTRQKIVFEQRNPGVIAWDRLKAALEEADPNKIDVAALAKRSQNAQFFASEVRRRVEAEDPLPVTIVLSQVMSFDPGEDLHPLKVDDKPAGLLFYVRFHEPWAPFLEPTLPERGGFRRGRPAEVARSEMAEPIDSLEPVLKPLHPRVFDIYEPEQFRKALRTIVDEVRKL